MTMFQSVVSVLISFALAVLIAGPLARPLRKHAWVFYTIASVVTALYLWYHFSKMYIPGIQIWLAMLQKGWLSCWLLAIVMFTGCFGIHSPIRRHLQPIRAELSILSFILMNAHAWYYLPIYLPNFFGYLQRDAWLGTSLIVSLVLTLLYVPLTVTSIRFLRTHMTAKSWKSIQRWAYVLVALLYLHIVFVLARPLFQGAAISAGHAVSLVVYLSIGVLYIVMRLLKWGRDQKAPGSAGIQAETANFSA